MADRGDPVQVIHAGAAQIFVGPDEAAGFDNVYIGPQAGGQAKYGAGVLGNIRLVESEAHRRSSRNFVEISRHGLCFRDYFALYGARRGGIVPVAVPRR